MTKTLTEQWREGTLESGMYYWQLPNNETFMATLYKMDEYKQTKDASKIICLAPVPDYIELKQTDEQIETLQKMCEDECSRRCRLEEQLAIATKALKGVCVWANKGNGGEMAVKRLCEKALKEMEGVK